MIIYSVLIPLALLVVPWLFVRYVFAAPSTRALRYREHAGYMWAAAVVWVVATVLPRPLLFGDTDTFILHTLGGVVAFLLFRYVVLAYKLRFVAWWQLVLGLYLFASGLGVLNELFELLLAKVDIMVFAPSYYDTSWDLTANTLGAFTALAVTGLVRRRSPPR